MNAAISMAPEHQEVKSRLVKLCLSILRPLVKILLRHGMSAQEFTEITRWVFVDVAMHEKEFALKSRSKTFKSRVAVITGLSRKEVLRLSSAPSPDEQDQLPSFNRAARVMTGWTENPQFCDSKDHPKLLPIKGGSASFHHLVRLYSGDVPPRAVLDELRRCGAVEIVDGDSVRLKKFAFFPANGSSEELDIVAMSASDLIRTMEYNTRHGLADEDKLPQRALFTRALPCEKLPEVREYVRKEIDAFARKIHHYLTEVEDKPMKSGVTYCRAGIGLYAFESG